jgi:hypothetical protein
MGVKEKMVNKRELAKSRKKRSDWLDLDKNDFQILNRKIREIMKEEVIDEESLKEQLLDFKKKYVIFSNPIIINNIYIEEFYKRIQINKAVLYAKENIPKTCFNMPDIYKISILDYIPKKNIALVMVVRRKNIDISSNDIKFEVTNLSFKNEDFERYKFTQRENYSLASFMRFTTYKSDTSSEGTLNFIFSLEMKNIGKISLNGICNVLSDNQNEILVLLKNCDKELKKRFFNKLMYKCFLKSKEIADYEKIPFPNDEQIREHVKYKKKN